MVDKTLEIEKTAHRILERAKKGNMALFWQGGHWRVCRYNDDRFMDLMKKGKLIGVYNALCPIEWIIGDMSD